MTTTKRRLRSRRKMHREITRFKKTGVCSAWLARRAQKKPELMAKLFPALMPSSTLMWDRIEYQSRIWFQPRIAAQLQAKSVFYDTFVGAPE